MDPHMSSALNQPPPAHNMSGPPQHPPHGLPMGQPIAPRVQPGYMSPRPAHTGSPVLMPSKASQPPALGAKPIQAGSASPKPSQSSSSSVQDKTMVTGSLKPTSTPIGQPNLSSNASVCTTKGPIISSLTQSSASKSVHNLPQPQYQQPNLLQQHQQRHLATQHMQQQPLTVTQHMQVSQQQQQQQQQLQHPLQQLQEHQQQSHHLHASPQQTPQQLQLHQHQPQLSTHSTPAPQQQHQPIQAKTSTHNVVSSVKQEATKGQTPPVPDLISIKQSPSHPVSAPTVKPALFDTPGMNQNQLINSKPFQQSSANNPSVAVSPVRQAQSVNSGSLVHSGNSVFPPQSCPPKPLDSSKTVSIIPTKPVSSQKTDASKSSDGNNTVTITPSVKPSESQEQKSNGTGTPKSNTDSSMGNQSAAHLGPNQNGMPAKPATNVGSKPELGITESKVSAPSIKHISASSVPQESQLSTKNNQQSPVKQSVSAISPKHPPTQSPATTKMAPGKSPSAVLNNQTESSVTTPSTHGLQTKLSVPPHTQQKGTGPAVSKTTTVYQPSKTLPSVSPLQSQSSTTPPKQSSNFHKSMTGIAANRPSNVPSKENSANVPSTKKIPEKTKIENTTKSEEASDTQVKVSPKSDVAKLSRTRKVEKKETSRNTDNEESAELDDHTEVANASTKRTSRTLRRVASEAHDEGERRSKRSRNPAPVYQSPIPDSLSRLTKRLISTPKTPQEKLVYFFKNEHVALRNAEGTFYLCQIVQNVYRSTRKIKIRWLTPSLEGKEECETYKPDYYDVTDFDCILTSVALEKSDQRSVVRLPAEEKKRIMNILQRAIDRDKGLPLEKSELSEDHPDGLDLSLYNDESQLKKRKNKQKKRRHSSETDDSEDEEEEEEEEDEDEDEEEDEVKEPPKKVANVDRSNSPLPRGRPSPALPPPSQSTVSERPAPGTPIPRPRRGSRGFGSSRSVTRTRTVPDPKAEGSSSPLPKPDLPSKEVSEELPPRNQRAARSVPKAVAPKPVPKPVSRSKPNRRSRK